MKTSPANKMPYLTPRLISVTIGKYTYNVISTTTQDLSDLDFDLLRSLNVIFNYAVRLSIYAFLIVFNGNLHV